MKYTRALEYVLQNAPVRAKDPEKKVCIKLSFVMSSFSQNRKIYFIEKSSSYGFINNDENQS
jgi:hypothetical protein